VLERFGMADCNPRTTPLPTGFNISEDQLPTTDAHKLFMRDKPYREVLGCLMW
ncbi:hypothetical protein BDZ94DRAFT_1141636, partial [Collybia nuda]